MAGVVVDTSVWIDFFAGNAAEELEEVLSTGAVIIPPIVVAELISGANARERGAIGELLQDAPLHETPLDHWIRVGDLRRELGRKGVAVTIPDAHVAQCALDRDAVLLSRDAAFVSIARHTALRLRR